jgi:hypothetical protein
MPKAEALDGMLKLLVDMHCSFPHLTPSPTVPMLWVCTQAAKQGCLPSTSLTAKDVSSRIALPILQSYGTCSRYNACC